MLHFCPLGWHSLKHMGITTSLKEHWKKPRAANSRVIFTGISSPAPTMRMLSFLFKTLPAGFKKALLQSFGWIAFSCSSYHYLIFTKCPYYMRSWSCLTCIHLFGRDMPSVFSHCQCSFWVGNTAEEICTWPELSSVDSFKQVNGAETLHQRSISKRGIRKNTSSRWGLRAMNEKPRCSPC